ncbi:MAG: PHP domain-containing protein [Clostridiales bacterium]|jgi:putative hydrolase|nr:PHP domain-containing protein [Clostridiales bacterium]
MYNLKVDCHTHTIHTAHAYSTIAENVTIAAEKGLEAIAITDHFGLQLSWFQPGREYNLENHLKPANLPKIMGGVRVFKGVEIDIVDFDGTLAGSEMPIARNSLVKSENYADFILNTKDMVIASLHYFHGHRGGTVNQNTQMYINVLARKNVDILGHPTRCGLEFHWPAVVDAAKRHGKMLEINNETLRSRPHQAKTERHLAQLCAEAGVPIVVGSDAHICYNVGEFALAIDLLTEIGFPEELIASRSLAAFEAALGQARGRL